MDIEVFKKASNLEITSDSFSDLSFADRASLIEILELNSSDLREEDMIKATIELSDEIYKIFKSGTPCDLERVVELVEKKEQIADLLGIVKEKYIELPLKTKLNMHDKYKTIDCSYITQTKESAFDFLIDSLGEEFGTLLADDWKTKADIDLRVAKVPEKNSPILFLNSNSKTRETQALHFREAKLKFADDIEATIYCAALVKKAMYYGLDFREGSNNWHNEKGFDVVKHLTTEEKYVLKILRDGVIRTENGSLDMNFQGPLRVKAKNEYLKDNSWAFGSLF